MRREGAKDLVLLARCGTLYCPFDPLAREFTPLVCGLGQALMTGIAEGVGEDRLQVHREPHPDRCCGVITLSP